MLYKSSLPLLNVPQGDIPQGDIPTVSDAPAWFVEAMDMLLKSMAKVDSATNVIYTPPSIPQPK